MLTINFNYLTKINHLQHSLNIFIVFKVRKKRFINIELTSIILDCGNSEGFYKN